MIKVNLQKSLTSYWVLVAFFLVGLLFLTMSRFALTLWQGERVFSSHAWLNIFSGGVRIDISTLSYISLPLLLLLFISRLFRWERGVKSFTQVYLVIFSCLIVFFEIITPTFISEYDLRPNRLFIDYLAYVNEVSSMLLAGYKLEIIISLVAIVLTAIIARWLFRWRWQYLAEPVTIFDVVVGLLLIFLVALGARNTFSHRPLNPAMVSFSTDHLLNDLSLNSLYSVAFALKQLNNESSSKDYYGDMPRDKVVNLVRSNMTSQDGDYNNEDQPTLHYQQATYKGKKRNLVIVLLESLGARYVGGLGGLPLTPNLDQLMKEGWNFTNLYATGTRSVRGIEAVVTGFTPTPSRSVVKLDKSQHDFFTIAKFLKNKGYQTQFVYGGESHFDNMKSFFLGNGFEQIVDVDDFENIEYEGSWGASDEDLFKQADIELNRLHAAGKPFFSLIFTSSNHSPFEYPDDKIIQYDRDKQTRNNAAKYSDFALGEFFDQAKKSPYWNDTVFLIVADHDSRVTGASLVPIDRFKVPGIIIGKDIATKDDNHIVSQIDLAPTLLSLIGTSGEYPMIGHDLSKAIPEDKYRALMQYDKNFAYYKDGKVIVLQPDKEARMYERSGNRLVPIAPEPSLVEEAKAHVLFGSFAYNSGWYQ